MAKTWRGPVAARQTWVTLGTMNVGKALAMTAVTGMLAGLAACGAEQKAELLTAPSTNSAPPPTEKSCCSGRNECKGKSGCKTETNGSCAGTNTCRAKGTSCPKA